MKRFSEDFTLAIQDAGTFEEYTFFEFLKKRKIIFNQNVDDTVVERVIMQILKWNEEDKDIPVLDRKPIELYINTSGGIVDIGLVLCEVVKKSTTPIVGTVLGMAASMGSLLLAACHHRKAYLFSNVLIHDGSTGVMGTTNKVKDHIKFQERKDEQIRNFLLDNTTISPEKYDDMSDREWWLTATDCLEYGIIHEIIQ